MKWLHSFIKIPQIITLMGAFLLAFPLEIFSVGLADTQLVTADRGLAAQNYQWHKYFRWDQNCLIRCWLLLWSGYTLPPHPPWRYVTWNEKPQNIYLLKRKPCLSFLSLKRHLPEQTPAAVCPPPPVVRSSRSLEVHSALAFSSTVQVLSTLTAICRII